MHMASYSSAGYALGPVVLPPTLVQRVHAAMDDVMAGRYETGQKPLRHEPPGFNPARDLTKIDQPHLANRTIFAAITQPAFGAAIAAITGARRVQVWAVQLLHKPGGSTATASVGWHQDFQYWHKWWTPDSRLFTAWLAISNVAADSGPMCFVPGSHRWGFLNAGNFFGDTGEKTRSQIRIPAGEHWAEVPATMPAGAFSVHHMLTYHGSHPNRESTPRRSFAVHLCAEGSTPLPGNTGHYDYVSHLDDPSTCPVIWDSPSSPTT
jgi:ectoine hydroxylase-related dioxygenase (phytanoyl-CoA dioxygenase family)